MVSVRGSGVRYVKIELSIKSISVGGSDEGVWRDHFF